MGLNAKLVVVGGDVKVAEINLKLPATVGRGRGTTIMLPHPLVSRQHCEIFERDGYLVVRDLGSLNGTYVGQEKITEAPVAPDSLLTIGSVTFRAVYQTAAAIPSVSASDTSIGQADAPAEAVVDAGTEFSEVDFTETAPAPQKAQQVPAATVPVVPPKPAAAGPAIQPAAKPGATAPKPSAPTTPVVPPAEAEEEPGEAADEEDDFQSFLKSLGDK